MFEAYRQQTLCESAPLCWEFDATGLCTYLQCAGYHLAVVIHSISVPVVIKLRLCIRMLYIQIVELYLADMTVLRKLVHFREAL